VHGIILVEFSKFARARLGATEWTQLCDSIDSAEIYKASAIYPDDQLEALLGAVSKRASLPRERLLEEFGEFIVPPLLDVYGPLVPEDWQLFDLLENTESVIHHVVRLRDPNADPPRLRIERSGPTQLTIHYDSRRNMCWFGKGIVKGLSRHFGQDVAVIDHRCMGRGDSSCEIEIASG
jgi:predicted hydrocarbon binding protein